MKPERPPEGWLLKAWDGETLIDLIFQPDRAAPIDDGYFERAEEIEVAAQPLPVASLGDVLTTKLLALNEQEPDLSSVLELARSLREQIDWDFVRERTAELAVRARVLHAGRGARRRRRGLAAYVSKKNSFQASHHVGPPRRGSCARRAARRRGGSGAGRRAGCA